MFLAVILLVWTGMHIYVFWRVSSVPVVARHVPRGVLWAVACILWMSYIVARIVGHFAPGGIARISANLRVVEGRIFWPRLRRSSELAVRE